MKILLRLRRTNPRRAKQNRHILCKLRILQVVDPATLNFDVEDERELQFQRKLLEECLVRDSGLDREGNPKQGVTKRKQEAEDILKFFGAPWNVKYGIVIVIGDIVNITVLILINCHCLCYRDVLYPGHRH